MSKLRQLMYQRVNPTQVVDYAISQGMVDESGQESFVQLLTESRAQRSLYYEQVLRSYIRAIENRKLPLIDELHVKYCQCITQRDSRQNDTIPVYYVVSDHDDIIELQEKPNIISVQGGTGHRTWEAALFLSEYLLTAPDWQSTTKFRVLELGAGTGLVGLVAAFLGQDVVLTDGDAIIVEQLHRTLEKNPWAKANCSIRQLWWSSQVQVTCDYILCADVTYDPLTIPALVECLFSLLAFGAKAALVSATKRSRATIEKFYSLCDQIGLTVSCLTTFDPELSYRFLYIDPKCEIEIYEVTRFVKVPRSASR